MRNSLKTRYGFLSVSDNATQQVLCKALLLLLVVTLPVLGLPPQTFSKKGPLMKPTCGRRPEQSTLNFQQNPASPVYQVKALDKPQSNDSLEGSNPKELTTRVPAGQDAISPLEWLLNPSKVAPRLGELGSGSVEQTFDRILSRLIQLEAHEGEASLRDDYKISWLIVRFCQTGEAKLCTPQVLATYKVVGCHPDQVWHRIVARRQALLGWRPVSVIRPKASAAHPKASAKSALAPPISEERKKA